MEAFQPNSHLDNQHLHPDLSLQSDPSTDTDKLVQVLAQDLENLVISCKDGVLDRDLKGHSVVIDGDDEVKRAIDDELRRLVVKEFVNEAVQAESSNGIGQKNHRDVRGLMDEAIERYSLKKVAEKDPKECRVFEERKAGESGIEYGNYGKNVDDGDHQIVIEHDEMDLTEKQDIEIVDGDGGGEFGGYEYTNGEQKGSEDGNDREYENVQDLENESEIAGGDGGEGGSVALQGDDRWKSYHYPLRPDAEDCSYYMRTGMCKFGSNCKFNHPLKRKNQSNKETKKQKEENLEWPGHIECKYYLSSSGCKYGKACKFNHARGKSAITSVVEYNFLGLPIRPGEKECPYYMRNGSCKYGPNCRFNHPDPTAVGGSEAPTTYGNDGPLPLQTTHQSSMPTGWPAPRTPDPSFVPMMYPPTQNIPPPNADWNYQAPAPPIPTPVVYPSSERGLPIPPAFFLNNPPSDTNMYVHHQPPPPPLPQMVVSDYPERPGQPECSYFMKTGDCKYRASCKFHHPKSRITKTTSQSVLSDKGLPLRPDQNICAHYSRYGICKYGPACKYDHPVNYKNSMPAGDGYRADGSDGPLIQQSV